MVAICRWPKASYKAALTDLVLIPSRAAVSRSTFT